MGAQVFSPSFKMLVAILTLSTCGSACRFGNHVSDSDTSASTSDPITGYYETQAKTLTFCAEGATTQCVDSPLTQIPAFFKAAVTNPVALLLEDASTGAGYILASDGSGYNLPTAFSSTANINYSGATTPDTLWDDSACKTSIQLDETGTLSKTASSDTSADGLPLSGAVTLTLTLVQSFEGDCSSSLTSMQGCMTDPSLCGGTSDEENVAYLQAVQDFFAPYLTSGVITSSDIPQLTSLSYEVTYE
jgi:hypothetical protein